ncbi:IclR family transcriptional regulator [Geomicrobium sp. JCM 19055]|uniref:IclR family transcriptional regulator n=1 Tax=Geomicrobium sp. JCM 19055 TaxID=1460649 RepID=UPI00045ECDD1|nr:IclR family transcriptional regulator [Geomicrobium sp. JCM 19055]GAJ97842.1 transcriptional regulator, IclR family [Geomicrobium sp. JCM 19055]
MEKKDSLRTVQRALDILDCFSMEKQELTLTEISNMIELAKSTTTRMLSTLETNGLIIKNESTMKYKLGHKLYYLGSIAGKSFDIKEVAKPVMSRLRELTSETVNLYTIANDRRICIEQFEGFRPLRHLVSLGQPLPLFAGAGGKVLLAYQSPAFQERIFKQMNNPERLEVLKRDLKQIKEQGYAVTHEEREQGLSAISAPIFNQDGEVHYCISISGLAQRFTEDNVDNYLASLKELVHQLLS